METETKKKLTKEAVEQELYLKEGQIEQRLAVLQEEVATVGPSIQRALFSHPLVSIGGALLAGVAVGLLFGGRKRPKNTLRTGTDHRALVDHYVKVVMDEARHRVAEGQDVDTAVRVALEDRVPLIVYEVPETERSGVMKQILSLALHQFVPLGIQMGMHYLTGDAEGGEGDEEG